MGNVDEFGQLLTFNADGSGSYTRAADDRPRDYLNAGELTACITYAAATEYPDREIRSVNCTSVHAGGQLAACTASLVQSERQCVHGQIVTGPRVADLVRHQSPAPCVAGPDGLQPRIGTEDRYLEVRVAGDSDPLDTAGQGPPEWNVWVRSNGDCDRPGVPEALVSFAANTFLVSAATLPHAGLSMYEAHNSLMAVINTTEVVFHAPVAADDWLLFHQKSTFAGGGWIFGRGEVFDRAGALLASFSEAAMLREVPARAKAPA
jgi:acyl-CoA thioesterase II